MRILLGLLLVVHGVAYLPGFVVLWRLASPAEMPYKTTVMGGSLDLGRAGIRMVGILWLLAALGFIVAGTVTFRGSPAWPALTLAVTLFSLAVCILGWPDTRIGLAVDIVILALLIGARAGWLAGVNR
jgi:hypothetical protein